MEIVTCITISLCEAKHVHCKSFVAMKGAIVGPNNLESRPGQSWWDRGAPKTRTFGPVLCFLGGRGMSVVAIRRDLEARVKADDDGRRPNISYFTRELP